MKRVIIYIDASNFYFHAKSLLKKDRLKFNWAPLVCAIKEQCFPGEDYRLLRAYYYAGLPDPRVDNKAYRRQRNFLEAINMIGFIHIRTGYILKNKKDGTNSEKGVDTMIATNMAVDAMEGKCDAIILVSGDSDFTYCINEINKRGIETCVCCPAGTACEAIAKIANNVVRLDKEIIERFINNKG